MVSKNQRNGQVVMEALHSIGAPARLKNILHHISACHGHRSESPIKSTVKNILRKGVRNGFIIKYGRNRYTNVAIHKQCVKNYEEENIKNIFQAYVS